MVLKRQVGRGVVNRGGIHLVLAHDEAHFDVLRVYVVPGLDLAVVDANDKGPLVKIAVISNTAGVVVG